MPMLLRLDVRDRKGGGFRFFFPVVLVWILAAALFAVLFPLMLIAALATRRTGPGWWLLRIYPLFFGLVFSLSGLKVDVTGRKGDVVFLAFD